MIRRIRTATPKARKSYRCDFCQCEIEKGTIYQRYTLIYDSVYDWITHLECSTIACKLDMHNGCDDDGLSSDGFREELNQYLWDKHEDMQETLDALTYIEKVRFVMSTFPLVKIN